MPLALAIALWLLGILVAYAAATEWGMIQFPRKAPFVLALLGWPLVTLGMALWFGFKWLKEREAKFYAKQ